MLILTVLAELSAIPIMPVYAAGPAPSFAALPATPPIAGTVLKQVLANA
jgi:hypothetical protein